MSECEIEKRFIVKKNNFDWMNNVIRKYFILQCYIDTRVRIRIEKDNKIQKGFICMKFPASGIKRTEFKFEIDYEDALVLIRTEYPNSYIEKTRYVVKENDLLWEIDVFSDANCGLIMAEIELDSEEQKIKLPEWIEKEATEDERYYNHYLATNPYKNWKIEVD